MGFLRILASIFNYRNIQVEEIKNYTMVIMDPESIDIEKGLYNQWFLKQPLTIFLYEKWLSKIIHYSKHEQP